MPRATYNHTTPEPRAAHYVRATTPVAVTLHTPAAPGEVRIITGRMLGAAHVDGVLHHYRVAAGDGTFYLAPPEWLAPECRLAVVQAGLMVREDLAAGMFVEAFAELTRQWASVTDAEILAQRFAGKAWQPSRPEGVA